MGENEEKSPDSSHPALVDGTPSREHSSLLFTGAGKTTREAETRVKIVKAGLYAVQVFYSFFIM